jgi:diguanylate cyclase (GGDEF)-like protein
MSDSQGAARRVLIAEDDAHTRNLVRELCEGWGFSTLCAEDGEQALALAAQPLDLALLDLMMPGIDGFEVLKRLRAESRTRDLPVIIITAIGDVDGKIRGLELGADDYITKPFRIAELQRRIEAVIAARKRAGSTAPTGTEAVPEPIKDALTGVGTFPQLKAGLERELLGAREAKRSLALLIVAVDDFALVQDRVGRDAANEVLVALTRLMRAVLRRADCIYRIDVEAFVALLPDTDGLGARQAAQRLMESTTARPLEMPGRVCPITVSMGVSSLSHRTDQQPDDLLREANNALIEARRQGAGRIEVAVAS